ncbi:MAG: hypothetical protein CMI01_11155 [Oceanospirillaceae bacterium]|jgi:hypothetical protein|uniref:hypothetical protein n=1 Tax=Marinobacterium litorale TaxID=404770 RepID=UPI00040E6548|nr:hypothetical protein [Marinobacterium litorale]MBS99222.1 hypothetical protein [Oceanospirillaceae bacterium]
MLTLRLKRFAENPWVNLLSGVILLLTSGHEIWETIDHGYFGAHHGVAIYGLMKVLQSFPHIVHGSEEVTMIVKD